MTTYEPKENGRPDRAVRHVEGTPFVWEQGAGHAAHTAYAFVLYDTELDHYHGGLIPHEDGTFTMHQFFTHYVEAKHRRVVTDKLTSLEEAESVFLYLMRMQGSRYD